MFQTLQERPIYISLDILILTPPNKYHADADAYDSGLCRCGRPEIQFRRSRVGRAEHRQPGVRRRPAGHTRRRTVQRVRRRELLLLAASAAAARQAGRRGHHRRLARPRPLSAPARRVATGRAHPRRLRLSAALRLQKPHRLVSLPLQLASGRPGGSGGDQMGLVFPVADAVYIFAPAAVQNYCNIGNFLMPGPCVMFTLSNSGTSKIRFLIN